MVLTRKIPMWRDQTVLDVAGDLELKSCIAHPASQQVLSDIWVGKVLNLGRRHLITFANIRRRGFCF